MTPDELHAKLRAALPYRDYNEKLKLVADRFARDTADHKLTISHDVDGYRHLRLRADASREYWFDVVTWPGVLTVHGDMGTYSFARERDMFAFFRGDKVNPAYWAEKTQGAADLKEFDQDELNHTLVDTAFEWAEEQLAEAVAADEAAVEDGREPTAVVEFGTQVDELAAALTRAFGHVEGEQDARDALDSFTYRSLAFYDTWEWSLTSYTHHFLWNCHALVAAIARYDATLAQAADEADAEVAALTGDLDGLEHLTDLGQLEPAGV